jgi:hypothetical protein
MILNQLARVALVILAKIIQDPIYRDYSDKTTAHYSSYLYIMFSKFAFII